MNSFLRDLVFATRTLRNRPGFTVAAALTLALGVAASTGMYSVIRATLLRPLPFKDADQLAVVIGVFGPDQQQRGASYPEVMDWRAANRAFSGISVFDATTGTLSGDGDAEQVSTELVSSNYFDLLGTRPLRGRALQAGDDLPGGPRVAVLSHDLWQRRYGGDETIIGRTITVTGVPLTVVGVMPEGFRGVSFGSQLWSTHAALRPQVLQDRRTRWLGTVARLAPGVSQGSAESSIQSLARELEARFPDFNEQRSATVTVLRDWYLGTTERLLVALFGAVLLLLLIACVNVTSLQLVRATGRTHEMSLRHALGATRSRLLQQLLAEGLVLSVFAGVLGIIAAYWGLQALAPLLPANVLPAYATLNLDPSAALFALGAAVLCGAGSALVPAIRVRGRELASELRERGASGGRPHGRLSAQQLLIAGEIALTFVVLASAGLMVRSFQRQLAVDPGYSPRGVLAARINLPTVAYAPERRRAFVDAMLERVRALPGVTVAAVASDAPMRGNDNAARLQRLEHSDDQIRYFRHRVTPDFFRAIGLDVVRGRSFGAADATTSDPVVIISEAAAQRIWPGQDALGQKVRLGQSATDPIATVVGISRNARHRSLTIALTDPTDDPDFYLPYAQQSTPSFELILRTTVDQETLVPALRRVIAELDPTLPLYTIDTLDAALAAATAQPRFASFLFSLFALLSLILAAVGLYGVMAYYVSSSRREIAIRLAIGAEPLAVQRMILLRGGTLVVSGMAVGAACALGLTRTLSVLLFGVGPSDPITFAAVVIVLGAAGFFANWLPARRATRVDPQLVLRS